MGYLLHLEEWAKNLYEAKSGQVKNYAFIRLTDTTKIKFIKKNKSVINRTAFKAVRV